MRIFYPGVCQDIKIIFFIDIYCQHPFVSTKQLMSIKFENCIPDLRDNVRSGVHDIHNISSSEARIHSHVNSRHIDII